VADVTGEHSESSPHTRIKVSISYMLRVVSCACLTLIAKDYFSTTHISKWRSTGEQCHSDVTDAAACLPRIQSCEEDTVLSVCGT
jgi:hypothetical protein